MWIIHLIALGAFLFGCNLAYLSHQVGGSAVEMVAWPLGLLMAAYGVSILAVGVAGGGNIGELKKIVVALFRPGSIRANRPE